MEEWYQVGFYYGIDPKTWGSMAAWQTDWLGKKRMKDLEEINADPKKTASYLERAIIRAIHNSGIRGVL